MLLFFVVVLDLYFELFYLTIFVGVYCCNSSLLTKLGSKYKYMSINTMLRGYYGLTQVIDVIFSSIHVFFCLLDNTFSSETKFQNVE